MTDDQRLPRILACALLFLLIGAALAAACWPMIQAAGTEAGDFAANSLLVQDAKRLHLLYGNYSRVGFNHPGPAILYVLAAGELLFHDWLHVVPSPFGGQLLAALLYNAAWMTLVFAIVRRSAGALQALLFVAVFVLATLTIDPALVNGMWFPHMYFFPYAAMLAAIAPLAYGRSDTLKALAVSSGFLVNGHVSFVPMLGITLALVLAANWLLSRRDPALRILSRAWMAAHRRTILAALGILFLFLVPLLIVTVRHFPGPVANYISFGRQNQGHGLQEAIDFVLVYWGAGRMPLWGGLLALVVAVLLVAVPSASRDADAGAPARRRFVQGARAMGIAFAAASLALLYYAKAGVDDLSMTYVAYFYYAVPAMCLGLAALYLCRALADGAGQALACLALFGVLLACWPQARKEPNYTYNYHQAGVAELYAWLHGLPGSGRIVLDLQADERPWGMALAVQVHAKRRHENLVCIHENWHVSHTWPARCRPEEVAANRRYAVRVVGAPDPVRGEPDVEGRSVALFRVGEPPRPLAYVTVKEQPAYFKGLLGKDWSNLEGEFVWTDGPVAEIDLPADPARSRTLTLDLGAFIGYAALRQHAQAFVDGRPAGRLEWNYFEQRRRFPIDLGPEPGAAKHIELKIAEPLMPKQFDMGDDTRQLGLSLYGIRKDPA
ncbi:hypothetical protein QPK32_10170 [Massilia sp. YIM B02763]|uniref:hypothetical protein n=1 Tax=Massilia sp. YIM B02763 TaxID=3050130 RepID=UPI0025B66225|nr:hypothetical protein [Massilia sp. YIM B02763]MDN4053444.1 hypothetical protein [Massilia sp. YIM B02763]